MVSGGVGEEKLPATSAVCTLRITTNIITAANCSHSPPVLQKGDDEKGIGLSAAKPSHYHLRRGGGVIGYGLRSSPGTSGRDGRYSYLWSRPGAGQPSNSS
jgi:hypothetical protein